MEVRYSNRLNRLPTYLFAKLEQLKLEKKKQGVDIISLSIGDPDMPTIPVVIDELVSEARKPENHQYPSSQGEGFFREGVAHWYKNRFGVEVDAEKEVINLIGGKEGIANLARAYVDPGDKVLVPDPAYPVYKNGATILCDGIPVDMPLREENGFLPDLNAIPEGEYRMMYINYPNNPTGAVASKKFLEELVEFIEKNNIILCYDNAYSEFSFDDYNAPSILEFTRNAIEINSCSKMFCMTGHRVGFAAGDEKIVAGLKKVKPQLDSGCPMYIQKAAVKGLDLYTSRARPKEVEEIMKEYERRRDVLVAGLNKLGIPAKRQKATFYLWVNVGGNSMEFAMKWLEKGVIVTPGSGFGENGEGFVRFALTQSVERIQEALERMKE
ncbi:MAG: aminotransferase class I/II-fold pyridoxal phosphate-dependent enzyme [Candidatus Micrarchaeota archaeon]